MGEFFLASSGVAAGNCNGYTFHNALRAGKISKKSLSSKFSPQVLAKLKSDFCQVQCIVIDEFSMVSLVLLAFLDKVFRAIHITRSKFWFAGIPILISGDGFQLPVVGGKGILSNLESIQAELQDIFTYFTEKLYFLELEKSVRQGKDKTFYKVLMRMRISESTIEDTAILNNRYVQSLINLIKSDVSWSKAPILSSRNSVVDALNINAINSNGSKYGSFLIYNFPLIPVSKGF